jgi:hypothetical protein
MIQRHEALRTGFQRIEGDIPFEGVPPGDHVVQAVLAKASISLDVESISPQQLDQREAAVDAFLKKSLGHPFSLSAPPLLRARLLKIDEHDHILILIVSHLISDLWSQRILRTEFNRIYHALSSNLQPELSPVGSSFAEYCNWERKWSVTKEATARAIEAATPMRMMEETQVRVENLLAPRRPGRVVLGHRKLALSPEIALQVTAVARQQKSSLFVVLLTAFLISLYRFTRQKGVGVWINMANRAQPQYQNTVGWFGTGRFIGVLPSPRWQGEDWVKNIQSQIQHAVKFEEVLPTLILEQLPSIELSNLPIYFDVIKEDRESTDRGTMHEAPSLEVRRLNFERRRFIRKPIGLEFTVFCHGEGISLYAGYNTERIPALAIEKLLSGAAEAIGFLDRESLSKS